jgi:formylmethanofuran dehydrogenase subunit E
MTETAELFSRIRARHGHYCAMSTLGGRLGLAALAALGSEVSAFTATYRIDTCAADGIAMATGCLQEEGRLVIHNEGRHRLELRTAGGGGVAAELTARALAEAAACRRRLDAGEAAEVVLATVRTAPDAELIALMPLADERGNA